MIRMNNVSLSFEDKMILGSVSLNIERGETFVILGPSGAGKSSILKIVCNLWKPDTGSVTVNGVAYSNLNKSEVFRITQKIGMVFQGNALFDSITVGENVGYFINERGKKAPDEIERKVKEVLTFVNMEGTGELGIDQLSGGMKKRVAIARALAFDPDILLFDEPTTGLDPINTRSILELIKKIKTMGKTSIVVTHILNDAFAVADKLAVIKDGRIVESGNLDALLNSSNPFIKDFLSEYLVNVNYLTA